MRNIKLSAFGLLLAAAIVIAGVIALLGNDAPRAAHVRDVLLVIITLIALLFLVAQGLLIGILIFKVQDLVDMLHNKVVPAVDRASETVGTVRNTVGMVNQSIARPALRIASLLSKLRRANHIAGDAVLAYLNRYGTRARAYRAYEDN